MGINLFSSKDIAVLSSAIQAKRELSMARTLGDVSIQAQIVRATPVWGCDMLVRLEITNRNVYSTQYFRSVEEMQRAAKVSSFT